MLEFEHALECIKWDIVGVCEVKRDEEVLSELKSGHIFYHTTCVQGFQGVGFFINKKWRNNIMKLTAISERVCVLNLQLNKNTSISFIQVYAPTLDKSDQVVEEFYEDVDKALNESKSNWKIIMGDFNSKIGQKRIGEEHILGKWNYGMRNDRGERLIQFAAQYNMVIVNSIFQKKVKRMWTWASPDGVTKNQIDYFLCRDTSIFSNIDIINRFSFPSDHRPLRVSINLNTRIERMKSITKRTPINIVGLSDKVDLYKQELSRRFSSIDLNSGSLTVDLLNDVVQTNIIESIKMSCGKNKYDKTSKLSVETKRLIKARDNLAKKRFNGQVERLEFSQFY